MLKEFANLQIRK